eukprot:7377638-Prymnesium_polylepis.1
MRVPPKLVKRERLSTNSVEPLRASVLMYTLTETELAAPTCATALNVLVHTPAVCALVALPSSVYCWPCWHAWHSSAVLSWPDTIVMPVAAAKCGSKYTATSLGDVSLANRLASTTSVSSPAAH